MDNAEHGVGLLIGAAEEYGPSAQGRGVAHLEKLGLFVAVREVQSMDGGFMSLFISEVNASFQEGEGGIRVTCVGTAQDMPSAVGDAIGQWALGVLPVLARWRGQHSCISSERPVETGGGRFDLLAGPVIARGRPSPGEQPPDHTENLYEPMLQAVTPRKLAQRVHWLEMFTSKSGDGSVESTCRLNNRDWNAGRRVLDAIATAWGDSGEPLQTSRQFVLLLPQHGPRDEITLPSFWDRLRGRG